MKCWAILRRHSAPWNPLAGGLPRGGKRLREQRADAARRAEVEITPRAHLPLFFCLELAPEIDARHRLRDADDLLDGRIVGLPGDEPRLLVRDPPFTHRPAEWREYAKPALQGDALLDGALGHPQPFGAVVAEGSEPRIAPEPEGLHEHREVA